MDTLRTPTLRTPLSAARGLGSAKEGVGHWWAVRVTSVALVPLTLWFILSALSLTGTDYAGVVRWLGSPYVTIPMILLIVCTFHHTALGLQVVLEDYVHDEGVRIASILATKFVCVALAVAALFAVLKIAFGR